VREIKQGGKTMSIITGKGKDVKKNMKPKEEKPKLDFKKVKINKTLTSEGDSIRVRLLSDDDYTTFESHGSFSTGIYTTPCTDPTDEKGNSIIEGGRCLYCESVEKGFESEELKSKTRFIFAFYDLDLEMVRTLEVSYNQGQSLIDDIDSYADELNTYAFELKRKGSGTKTTYSLSPILSLKKDPGAQASFDGAKDVTVDPELYERVLYVKTLNQQAIELENAKFDVEGELGYTITSDKPEDNGSSDPNKVF
jgi:hypothetical protein